MLGIAILTVSVMYKEEGLLSFWKGVIPALILVSNPTIQYSLFERFRIIVEARTGRKISSVHHLLLGAIAKTVATFITYPYIVVKSRLQMKQTETDDARCGP